MAIEDKSDGRTVQLKRVRLSFTRRLKTKGKTSDQADKETHGLNIVLDHTQPTFQQNLDLCIAALKKAGELMWKNPNAYKDIAEDAPKRVCFRKGEKFKNSEGRVYAGYQGNYAFGANGPSGGEKRPKLLDRYKRKVEEADINDVFYGGCYADVIVSFYGTEKGSRGIFATIEAIRSHQEGERMGGGVDVDADDFDDIEDEDSFTGGSSSKDDDDLLG